MLKLPPMPHPQLLQVGRLLLHGGIGILLLYTTAGIALKAPPPRYTKSITYPKVSYQAFAPGEKLTYRLKYSFFTAGEAVFGVDSGQVNMQDQPCYHFYGDGRSLSTFEWFFKAHYRHDTYANAGTLRPLQYTHNRREGKYRFNDTVQYNVAESNIKGIKGLFAMREPTYDLLTAIYMARCLNVRENEIGKYYSIPTFYEDGIYPLGVKVVGRERIRVSAGTFDCILVQPRVIAGDVFKEDNKMTIWVTDDGNYIPVKIESPILIGTVRAELHGYSGTRFPVTSRVK